MTAPNPLDEFTPGQIQKRNGPGGPTARRIRRAVRDGELPASTYGGHWLRIRWQDYEAWREQTRVKPRKRAPRSADAERGAKEGRACYRLRTC